MSSVSGSGSWWSPASVQRTRLRGREAIRHAIGSVPAASSSTAAQDERGIRAAQAPPRYASSEDGVSPAAAAGAGSGGPENAAAPGALSPGLSAETAVAILVDCFGHG